MIHNAPKAREIRLAVSPVPIVVPALLSSIVALRTPALVHGNVGLALAVAPMAAAAYISLLAAPAFRGLGRLSWLLVLGALATTAIYRAGHGGVVYDARSAARDMILWGSFFVSVFVIFTAATDDELPRYRAAVAAAPVIYVLFNVVLYVLGVRNHDLTGNAGTDTTLLGLFGIHRLRLLLPMAVGVNNFGIVAGAAVCSAGYVVLRKAARRGSRIWTFGGGISLGVLLLLDSRGPLVFAGLAIMVAVLLPRVGWRMGVAALPFSPIVASFGLYVVARLAPGANLTRVAGGSLASGTGRTFIWQQIWSFIRHPAAELVYGYGAFGQVATGVANRYANFIAVSKPTEASAHNFFLQTLLDTGVIGVAAWLTVLVVAMKRATALAMSAASSATDGACLAMMGYMLLVGFTEAAPSTYAPESLALAVLLFAAFLRVGNPEGT